MIADFRGTAWRSQEKAAETRPLGAVDTEPSRQAPSPSNTASAGRQQSSAQRSRCPITSMPRSERQPPSFAILIKSRVDVFQLAELPIFVTVLTAPHAPPLSPKATVHRLHQGPRLLCPCSRSLVPRQVVPPFLIVSSQLEAPGSNSLNSWIQPLWLSPLVLIRHHS